MELATWESWYRHPKPQSVEYTCSIVSYLDILGFNDLIKRKTAGEISRILRILAESVEPHKTDEPATIQFTKFSDTVIRSIPKPKAADFIYELKSILRAQVALIPEDVTIRGAVTIGDIVQSWGVVYGPAVVRAYELERIKGSPPRIIIDDKALNLLDPPLSSALPGLARQEGSTIYLDYLNACEVELNAQREEYPRFLGIHRDFIRNNLTKYAAVPDVLGKYEWLRAYHGSVLQEKSGINILRELDI